MTMVNMPDVASPSPSFAHPLLAILLIPVMAILVLAYLSLEVFRNEQVLNGNTLLVTEVEILPRSINQNQLVDHDSEWTRTELPIHWRNQFEDTRSVWYRFNVPQTALGTMLESSAADEEELLGIYIWRLNQTANIWLNGQQIGSGGRTIEPMARHWNSPLYFQIPASLLQENNEFHINHFAQHSWGSMEAVVIGQEKVLKPIYERRYFIQHDVALGLFVFVLVTGAFSFTVWVNRRDEVEYLWFAIASTGLSFYCLNQFIRYLPMSADAWRWLSNISTDLWACSIFIFILRSLKLEKPKTEKLVYFYFLTGIPVYYYASYFHSFEINVYFHLGSISLGVYGFVLCVQRYLEHKTLLPAFYSAVIILAVIAGVHDTLMQAAINIGLQSTSFVSYQNHFNSVHFAAPVIFLIIGASLIKRFVDSMNAADSLNAELEERVSEARRELQENYAAIEEVLIRQSASEERERIYRDLHDDVGSKLLSLYYRLDKESDSILAKSALEDLRDIVSHKSLESCSLEEAAEQWRSEAQLRVNDAGIELSWQNRIANGEFILSELQHTQLRRMFREVFSNAILHSKQISRIKVHVLADENYLSISVENNGASEPVSQWKTGRGISNLRVRARDLRGQFDITDLEESWIRVSWKVPLESEG